MRGLFIHRVPGKSPLNLPVGLRSALPCFDRGQGEDSTWRLNQFIGTGGAPIGLPLRPLIPGAIHMSMEASIERCGLLLDRANIRAVVWGLAVRGMIIPPRSEKWNPLPASSTVLGSVPSTTSQSLSRSRGVGFARPTVDFNPLTFRLFVR